MLFDEPMNAGSLVAASVTLHNNGASETYTLTNSTGNLNGPTTVVINLSTTDFNAIVDKIGLCTGTSDSYLTLAQGAIEDMGGKDIDAVASVQAVSYTENDTLPNHFGIKTESGLTATGATADVTMNIVIRESNVQKF